MEKLTKRELLIHLYTELYEEVGKPKTREEIEAYLDERAAQRTVGMNSQSRNEPQDESL